MSQKVKERNQKLLYQKWTHLGNARIHSKLIIKVPVDSVPAQ